MINGSLFLYIVSSEANDIFLCDLFDQPILIVVVLEGFLPALDVEVEVREIAFLLGLLVLGVGSRLLAVLLFHRGQKELNLFLGDLAELDVVVLQVLLVKLRVLFVLTEEFQRICDIKDCIRECL
jgi:hypothetical protein